MNVISVHFDGGCRPTNPGNKYGSYQVLLNRQNIIKVSRSEFGYGTSNEAEFDALIRALKWTREELLAGGFHPNQHHLRMFTDSTLVVGRIQGKNKTRKSEPQKRMYALCSTALSYITEYKSHEIIWNNRTANLARFGH